MKKIIMLLAVVFMSAVCFAGNSAAPEFANQNTIVCGNKKITLAADGMLRITNASGEIASINLQYVFQDSASGDVDWINTTAALCKMKKDGNKVTWELWKQHKLHTWKVADQTIEILEDGKIKLFAQVHNPDTDKIKPRTPFAAFFIFFPIAGNEGKKMVFNGKEYKLAADMKGVSAWRGPQYDYELFAGNPEESVIFQNVDMNQTASIIVGKNHRISYIFQKEGKGAILIDLRK